MDSGSHRIVIRKTKPAFSQEQKVGLGLVIAFGGVAMLMGVFYIGSHLTEAFNVEYDGPPVLTHEQQQLQAIQELQTTDTDKDTLTDYEELYLYRSSPYLEDTDGDGMGDATEVASGSDPNCAPGKSCEAIVNDAEGASTNGGDVELTAPGVETLDENLMLIESLTTEVTAEQVRQFLLDNGADPELVNSYSDAELLTIYESVVRDMDESGESSQVAPESETTPEQTQVPAP